MAHVLHAAVDAITGSSLDGAADDYHACLYVIKKECATKDFDETNDLGLPAEVCLPVASPLWNRLAGSLAQVKHAARDLLQAQATASDCLALSHIASVPCICHRQALAPSLNG